jgi:hypothetical protein
MALKQMCSMWPAVQLPYKCMLIVLDLHNETLDHEQFVMHRTRSEIRLMSIHG